MNHDPSTPSRRMSGEERRSVIISAALREFSRAGYHGASTARIAAAAECSEPMLYKHFTGKQDLFTAVLIDTTRQLDELYDRSVLAAEGEVVEQIDAGIPMMFRDPLYADTMRMRMLAMSVIDLPGVREALEDIHSDMVARTQEAFDRSASEGNVSDGVDADYITWMWIGVQFASIYREAMRPGEFAEMLPHAQRFIASLIPTTAPVE